MMDSMQTKTSAQTFGGCPVFGSFPRLCRGISLAAGAGLLSAALLLAGCSKERTPEPVSGPDDGMVEIILSPESMGEVTMDTRAVSGVDENTVKDLWVIQLNADGTALLQTPQYITAVTGSGTSYKVKAKIKSQESRICFIANTGSSTLYSDVTTSADVESKTMAVTNEASLAPGNVLPMCGYYTGTPTASALPSVILKRAVAKLTFKLAADIQGGGSFTLTSIKVYNVPTALHLYRDPSAPVPGTTAADCYPATSVGFIGEFADLTPDDKTLTATAKECGWCYLPENGRGTGSATEQTQKTAATALGGAEGQGNYATYVEITGDYTTVFGDKYTGNIYRIYLGHDAVSDYNVLRNTRYTVTATIKGLNTVDARITVGSGIYSDEVYDYTDNRTGWFVYAKTDASTMLMSWQDALLACAKTPGWRLPTVAELEIIYCMRDTWEFMSNGLLDLYYWSAIEYNSSKAWYVSFNDGVSTDTYIDKSSSLAVRCVMGL